MKILSTLALIIMTSLATVSVAPAAQAGTYCETFHVCGDFKHVNDDGFDDPIPVTCNYANQWPEAQWVLENTSATCHDTDGFYVGPGKTVSCLFNGDGYAWVKYSAVGWHKINDGQNVNCVHGLA